MNQDRVIDISGNTILKIALTTVSLYIIYLIRDVLIWFIFAIIISILFNPVIDFLQKRKIPRVMAVVFVYLGTFGILSLSIYSTATLLFNEIQQFSQFFPQYFQTLSPLLKELGIRAFENIDAFTLAINGILGEITSTIPNALFSIFGGLFTTFFVISMAIFLSLEQRPIEKTLSLFFSKRYETYVLNLWARCQRKVSGWFLSRILACIFVGILSYFAFLLFSTKYPLTLGLLAGALNFIPIVGPIVTGFLIFVIASLDSGLKALFVVLAFILIQQIENNIVTPILSKKFIGISPTLVLIALVVGGKLWGFLGSILAIPLFGILTEFLRDFLKKKKEETAAP